MKRPDLDVRYRTEHELRLQFPNLSPDDQCEFFMNLCAAVQGRDRDEAFRNEIGQLLTPAQQKQCHTENEASYTDGKPKQKNTVAALMYSSQNRMRDGLNTSFNAHHILPIVTEWGLVDAGFAYRLNQKTGYLLQLVDKPKSVTYELVLWLSRGKTKRVLKIKVGGLSATGYHQEIVTTKEAMWMLLADFGLEAAIPYARQGKIDTLIG